MRILVLAAALSVCAAPAAAQTTPLRTRGQAILQASCSNCHAIGRTGASKHKQAPPFRDVAKRYPPQSLEEALGEGLITGHPDMPEFVFSPEDIAAIVAYLNGLRGSR